MSCTKAAVRLRGLEHLDGRNRLQLLGSDGVYVEDDYDEVEDGEDSDDDEGSGDE